MKLKKKLFSMGAATTNTIDGAKIKKKKLPKNKSISADILIQNSREAVDEK